MIQEKSIGNKKICFVIMGYGLKKDPDTGEMLDLDKTFTNIIKPVVKKIGFECIRCDKVNNSGLIDKVMYEYIWNADLVIADISTLNPNAMYELGVRHALRPSSTVIIAEERTNFVFDVGHNSIFRYKHLGVDIGVTEAKRCIKELTNHIKDILDKNEVDSPFYTYMKYNSLSDLCRDEILKEYIYDETFYNEHMICSLIPQWADTNENDRNLLSRLMNNNMGTFDINISKLKEIPSSPLKLKNHHWIYSLNDEIAKNIYTRFTPLIMDHFSSIAIEVLSEKNPKFDLPKKQRLFANFEGQAPKYSYDVRNGIAEGLVYLSLYKEYLSLDLKQRNVPAMVVYSILRTNDWKVWGSLDNLLPVLAEAAPDAFVSSLRNILNTSPETFISLFDQETSGLFGSSLMTGILWGLEVITWFPGYFGVVIECLAELAKLDKGGNVGNRPINSDVAIDWIERVLNLAKENKRLGVTRIWLGKLFFYTPRDNSSQLWIEKSIAKLFDKFENQDMRQGFETEAINSRGAHFVDPSGEEEKSIADSWQIKAKELESVGFYNFAQTAKNIAKTYIGFAEYNYMK